MNRWISYIIVLIIFDQFTKWLAVHLSWSIFFNDQFAFSLPLPAIIMFSVYAVVLTGILFYVHQTWEKFIPMQRYAWVLVIGGGLSNVGERIVLGHVRDFIPIANGMLNVADLYIFAGLILLLASQRFSKNLV